MIFIAALLKAFLHFYVKCSCTEKFSALYFKCCSWGQGLNFTAKTKCHMRGKILLLPFIREIFTSSYKTYTYNIYTDLQKMTGKLPIRACHRKFQKTPVLTEAKCLSILVPSWGQTYKKL
ncbi:hypothetical protein KP509_32G019400 [Ceratopteris richardii]|uniref:Secreted protein n=1 Tax=Ceratopteris richardii TaxID=49495 RepID=A0A8T2QTL6_CERRI|nr:hypothetical protein KP509_32G019400 [Ceratopteris richardii]